IEKAESSATAALLGRLCAGLGVTLSSVVAAGDRPSERLSPRAAQPAWWDPETGYVRRHVSPPGGAAGIEIIAVELPAGARVPYPSWGGDPYGQQLFMIDGELTLQIAEQAHHLADGDCIDFDVSRPVVFENRARGPARYLVVIRKT